MKDIYFNHIIRILKIHKIRFNEKESEVTLISESKEAIKRAQDKFYFHRRILERYVLKDNRFLNSFSPVNVKTDKKIIKLMANVAKQCDVGPMATVAGALADLTLESMITTNNLDFTPAKIALVENGGEIAIDSEKTMRVALFGGYNELNLNLGFLIEKKDCPVGIGTSSATIGHAISLGQADAVTIFANNATLADGAATKIANMVKGKDIEKSIKNGLDSVNSINGVRGAIISRENKIGHVGKLPKLVTIKGDKNKLLSTKIDTLDRFDFEIFR